MPPASPCPWPHRSRCTWLFVATAALSACASQVPRERVFFAESMSALQVLPEAPKDATVSRRIDAPAAQVAAAARLVLHQRALVFHASARAGDRFSYRYLDRTSFIAGGQTIPVEMVFAMTIEPLDDRSASLSVACHWNHMTDDPYRAAPGDRFDRLKGAMLAAALQALDRIDRQAVVGRIALRAVP